MDIRAVTDQAGREAAEKAHGWMFQSRRRLATIAVCLLATWMAYGVVSGPNGCLAYHRKKIENQQLQREVDQLQKQNQELDRHVKALQSDPNAIEKEARETLGYVKRGEMVYVLPEQKPANSQSAARVSTQKQPRQ